MTPYPVLTPLSATRNAQPAEAREPALCALAIMAKAPRAGKVKTRLSPPLTLAQTAALNVCFLKDTAENLDVLSGTEGLVCYTPQGDEEAFRDLLPSRFKLIPQRGDNFGDRLYAAAVDILGCGYSGVCLIDSDSPTVPHEAYAAAVSALSGPGDRVVLGPSHDGGYYLIGMKQPHREIFEDISWSTPAVAAETRERCRAAGLDLVELPLWYDVDDQRTLAILNDELLASTRPSFAAVDGYPAPHTRSFLLELDAPSDLVVQKAPLDEATG